MVANVSMSSADSAQQGYHGLPSSNTQSGPIVDTTRRILNALPDPRVASRSLTGMTMRYSTQLNEQLTSAQRALSFIERLDGAFEKLKLELSVELTQPFIDEVKLKAAADELAEQWALRHTFTQGSVDNTLRFLPSGGACQYFTIPGLDLASLTQGPPETLAFFTGGQSTTPPLVVNVGHGVSQEAILQAFKQVFSSVEIAVETDGNGELSFAICEAKWPRLRDRLMIRGGGVRFADGQPHHVSLHVEPDLFSIDTRELNQPAYLHTILQHLMPIGNQLQQVRNVISNLINEACHFIEQRLPMNDLTWANHFVTDFNAHFSQSRDYRGLHHVVPALMGINRHRVLSLLSLI